MLTIKEARTSVTFTAELKDFKGFDAWKWESKVVIESVQ